MQHSLRAHDAYHAHGVMPCGGLWAHAGLGKGRPTHHVQGAAVKGRPDSSRCLMWCRGCSHNLSMYVCCGPTEMQQQCHCALTKKLSSVLPLMSSAWIGGIPSAHRRSAPALASMVTLLTRPAAHNSLVYCTYSSSKLRSQDAKSASVANRVMLQASVH